MNTDITSENFIKVVQKEVGQNVNLCYQCKKCTSGCPIIYEMDYTPTQIIHAVRLGMKDLVLNSKTIWLCASCETCTTRCPQEIDIAKVMDTARMIARREKMPAAIKDVPAFNTSVLQTLRMFGRLYELGMLGLFKLRTRNFAKDKDLGIKMMKLGKLKYIPDFARVIETNQIFLRSAKMEERIETR